MVAQRITIEEAGEVNAGVLVTSTSSPTLAASKRAKRSPRTATTFTSARRRPRGTIYLEPGSHDLCLQVGDGVHEALYVTDTVTVEVGIGSLDEWCAVVGEVDELFAVSDEEAEFADQQGTFENVAAAARGAQRID